MFIQTEPTPNPATLKFLPGREVMGTKTREFRGRLKLEPLPERIARTKIAHHIPPPFRIPRDLRASPDWRGRPRDSHQHCASHASHHPGTHGGTLFAEWMTHGIRQRT